MGKPLRLELEGLWTARRVSTASFIGSTRKGTWSRSSRSTTAQTYIDAAPEADGRSRDLEVIGFTAQEFGAAPV